MNVKTLLVTQDFSQLKLTSTLIQELIMVFTCYKRGVVSQEYHHFIAPVGPGWTNDVTFVIGVWEALDNEGKFDPYIKVIFGVMEVQTFNNGLTFDTFFFFGVLPINY